MASNFNRDLRTALSSTPECLPLDQLERCIDPGAVPTEFSGHLESCTFCQSELALLRSFHRPPDASEAEAVREIERRLQSPRPIADAASRAWWRDLFEARWFRPAAIVMAGMLIVIAVGLQSRYGAVPRLNAPAGPEGDVMRSGTVTVIAPSGDLHAVPGRIEWQPVTGAARYRVRLLEVDGTELWSASANEAQLTIPAAIKAKIVPAKTLLLEVMAIDAAGRKLAQSDAIRFRVLQKIYTR